MNAPTLVKVAIIRRPGYPVGQAAPCYLNCPCGAQPAITESEEIRCACGRIYAANGWLVATANGRLARA